MDIQLMHIGLDLYLQRLNSNILLKSNHEEKDYMINSTTLELIKAILLEDDNDIRKIIGSSDIKKYYEVLQKYILSSELAIVEELGKGYIYASLPTTIDLDKFKIGQLTNGVKYRVVTPGGTNLTSFGGTNPPILNDEFVCDITKLTGVSITLVVGEKYRIINAHGGDFTAVGADNNNPRTEFIATGTGPVAGGVNTVIKPIKSSPSWDTTTELIAVKNIGYNNYLSIKVSVKHGNAIKTGELKKGKKYIITVPGTTDLSTFGAYVNNDTNLIFSCIKDGSPTWANSTLYEIKDVDVRLVKANVSYEFRDNSFGSSQSSPIGIIADNKIHVYHDNKFDIYSLFLEYIILPIDVDWNNSINSDLPISLHNFIVELTAKKLLFIENPTPTVNPQQVRQ